VLVRFIALNIFNDGDTWGQKYKHAGARFAGAFCGENMPNNAE